MLEVAENKAGDEVRRRRACSSKGGGDRPWPGSVRGGVGVSARGRPRSGAAKRGPGRAGARRWSRAEAGGRGRLRGGVGRIHDATSATVDGSGRESRCAAACACGTARRAQDEDARRARRRQGRRGGSSRGGVGTGQRARWRSGRSTGTSGGEEQSGGEGEAGRRGSSGRRRV